MCLPHGWLAWLVLPGDLSDGRSGRHSPGNSSTTSSGGRSDYHASARAIPVNPAPVVVTVPGPSGGPVCTEAAGSSVHGSSVGPVPPPARSPVPTLPKSATVAGVPRRTAALGSGPKAVPCSFTQMGMQLIHTMVRLTNAIDTLSGEMRRTREHSQPATSVTTTTLPPPPITTAAQRRRFEEQLEEHQRKERRTYERSDPYDDNNDTWEKGESSDRRSDRDGQDDNWGEWYYRKDWKR